MLIFGSLQRSRKRRNEIDMHSKYIVTWLNQPRYLYIPYSSFIWLVFRISILAYLGFQYQNVIFTIIWSFCNVYLFPESLWVLCMSLTSRSRSHIFWKNHNTLFTHVLESIYKHRSDPKLIRKSCGLWNNVLRIQIITLVWKMNHLVIVFNDVVVVMAAY